MIFTSQGDGQDNDLSIEAIVPDADSPEVAAYLDNGKIEVKLNTNTTSPTSTVNDAQL